MLTTFFRKISSLFKKKQKSTAIPFAERSKEAVKHRRQSENETRRRKFESKKRKPELKPAPPARTPKNDAPRNKTPRKAWSIDEFVVPEAEGKVRFHDLDLPLSILHAICDLKFQYCTPVQAGILPEALKGRDAIGKAQTGTGKSAAFLISILTHMIRNPMKGGPPKGRPRALILAPTRELVLQIEKDALGLCKYTPFKILAVFGGIGYEKQMKALKERSFDVIVATPGRLIDFKNKKLINLDKVEILVLDEADRMLDMGFIPDVRKIVYSTPHKNKRQTFFYSATFTPEVNRLAEQWTTDPSTVDIEPDHVAADTVKQVVYITTSREKFPLLYNLIQKQQLERVLIFTNRRDQARDLAKKLNNYDIKSALISGEVQQNKRIRALEGFRNGRSRVLVATDVAARGLHIEDISHVINFHLPQDPESYVHRIGRTGRAGTKGISVSFASEDDSFHIPDIEKFLGNDLVCEYPEDDLLNEPPEPVKKPEPKKSNQKPRSRRRGPRPSQKKVENGDKKPGEGLPRRRRRRRPPSNRRKSNGQGNGQGQGQRKPSSQASKES